MALSLTALTSCTDSDFTELETVNENQQETKPAFSNEMLAFANSSSLNEAIDLINSGFDRNVATRVALNGYGSSNFKSLLESNKEKFYATLTPEQIQEIENDEDELEYCLSDSIIADYAFAQLLNESREIQVADTVYRYFANGVAFAPVEFKSDLKLIDEEVAAIRIEQFESPTTLQLTTRVKFMPMYYKQITFNDILVDGGGGVTSSTTNGNSNTGEGLTLKNGVFIPKYNIRDVNYNSSGDGGWFHKLWNGIWGKNILAIKKFNGHRRMRLGFYDQNYIIYSNIGMEVKMQKKRCGIWWNCKTSEIRIGWSAVELRYKMQKPVKTYFTSDEMIGKQNQGNEFPVIMRCDFPFKNGQDILFNIPLINYDVKIKDVNKLLQSGLEIAMDRGSYILRQMMNKTNQNQKGIYSVDDKWILSIIGADEDVKTNAKTFEKKFYSKWGSFTVDFGYAIGGGISFKGIDMKKADEANLGRAVVYAAVKYGGEWKACRITKEE